MQYSGKGKSFWVKRHLANKLTYQPKRLARGLEPTLHVTKQQVRGLQTVVETYVPDLRDPAAVEVLLVLLEVCHILAFSEHRLAQIFGCHLHALESWGDIVPPKQRPRKVQRAWVWVPNTYGPKVYPIGNDGAISIYAPEQDGSQEETER
jgi:hypothetical protein